MSSAASQYTSGTLKPLMSMPMICSAACRASSSLRASLMPPALPRPPTGTCALTATGPSLRNAPAASSASRATAPGGMAMPSEARTSLAWYSRSFTPPPSSRERARSGRAVLVVVPAFAEALPELRAVDEDDVAAFGRDVGVREALRVLADELRPLRRTRAQLLAEEDVDRAFGAHDRNLGRRPRHVEVGADVLRAHHAVRASIRLAGDHCQLRHGRLAERVEQLRAVADDAAVLLRGPRQEAGHVDEREERDVEGVAEAPESRGLVRGV